MNAREFETLAIALIRTATGWQTKIARRLGYEPRTIRRWIAADAIPDHAAEELRRQIGMSDPGAQWPRGEWLVGRDDAGRVMVCHLQAPRFAGRIVYCDADGAPLPEEEPADVLSGAVYVVDGGDPEGDVVLCEIAWFDRPKEGEVVQLLEAAADAFEAWESAGAE